MSFLKKLYQSILKSNRPAQSNPLYMNMTKQEEFALRSYTRNSNGINAALRSSSKENIPKHYAEQADLISSALKNFPKYEDAVYRKIDLESIRYNDGEEAYKKILQQHQKGNMVQYPAFTSTSKDLISYDLGKREQLILTINNHSGKDISGFSRFDENEVLIDRNFSGKIISNTKDPEGKYHYATIEGIKDDE